MVKILCACGCGELLEEKDKYGIQRRFIFTHNSRGKNNANYGKRASKKCKEVNRAKMLGKKGKDAYAYGSKHPKLALLNKSRAGIPIKDDVKEKIRKANKKWWDSPAGLIQRKKTSRLAKEWARKNPHKKIEAAKNGHKCCPRISSLEIKFKKILIKNEIQFDQQKEYKLGFIDFFIEPNLAIFIDGNYWHNYPRGCEKDKKQTKHLQENGFIVLRIWEEELNKLDDDAIIRKVKNFSKEEILWENQEKDLVTAI